MVEDGPPLEVLQVTYGQVFQLEKALEKGRLWDVLQQFLLYLRRKIPALNIIHVFGSLATRWRLVAALAAGTHDLLVKYFFSVVFEFLEVFINS